MVEKLFSKDFFISKEQTIAIEPRIPQLPYPEHTHDFYEIVIVNQGRGLHILNGKPYELHPGMIFFIEAADHHLYENVEDLHLTNILFRSPQHFHCLNGIQQLLPNKNKDCEHGFLNKKAYQKVQTLLNELAIKKNDNAFTSYIEKESLFLQMLISLQHGRYESEGYGFNENRMLQVLNWLKAHFSEVIDWNELANQFELPLRTLYRRIKNDTGLSPQRYLTKLRLSEAYYQICHSDRSITDIAHDCGFNDSTYFSTCFKNEFGVAPKILRDNPKLKN